MIEGVAATALERAAAGRVAVLGGGEGGGEGGSGEGGGDDVGGEGGGDGGDGGGGEGGGGEGGGGEGHNFMLGGHVQRSGTEIGRCINDDSACI